MHCLHVLDALDDRGSVRALLHLLRLAAFESAFDETLAVHDVLALAGGPLEREIRTHARRVTLAASGLEITAAVLTRDYDIVHALDASSARRLAPLITSAASAAFIYSGPALIGAARRQTHGAEPAHRALLAASDLVVMAPETCESPVLGASLVHRSVCLDLARLAEPEPADLDGGAGIDVDAPELHFIVREWAAVIGGLVRGWRTETDAETLHP
jgi:hypothetical protein